MPLVATVAGCAIRFYYRDHEPAHFHAALPDGTEMLVRITDLAILAGSLPVPQRRAVLAWAAQHQDALAVAWLRCREKKTPGRIE